MNYKLEGYADSAEFREKALAVLNTRYPQLPVTFNGLMGNQATMASTHSLEEVLLVFLKNAAMTLAGQNVDEVILSVNGLDVSWTAEVV